MQVQVSLTIEIEASAGITEGERHLFAKGLDREQPGCEDRPKIARKKENEALDQNWQQLSEQILTDIKAWRRAHPKATLREIEEEVHSRLSRLEAQVIQDSAQESEQRDWSGSEAEQRPLCPTCGTGLISPR